MVDFIKYADYQYRFIIFLKYSPFFTVSSVRWAMEIILVMLLTASRTMLAISGYQLRSGGTAKLSFNSMTYLNSQILILLLVKMHQTKGIPLTLSTIGQRLTLMHMCGKCCIKARDNSIDVNILSGISDWLYKKCLLVLLISGMR